MTLEHAKQVYKYAGGDRDNTATGFARRVREEYARITGNEPQKASEAQETLKPCPLCGGEADDLGHGISCRKCGLWLGNNISDFHRKNGGYRKIWNSRK